MNDQDVKRCPTCGKAHGFCTCLANTMSQTDPMTAEMMVTYLNACKTYDSQVALIAQRDRAILEAAVERGCDACSTHDGGCPMYLKDWSKCPIRMAILFAIPKMES